MILNWRWSGWMKSHSWKVVRRGNGSCGFESHRLLKLVNKIIWWLWPTANRVARSIVWGSIPLFTANGSLIVQRTTTSWKRVVPSDRYGDGDLKLPHMEDELIRLLVTLGKRWVLKGIDFEYYFFHVLISTIIF